MKNINQVMKRVCAYMMDIIFVMIIASLIVNIPFIRKDTKKYEQTYKEYEEKYNKLDKFKQLLETAYEDNKITEEEYNELAKEEKYKDIIIEKYEDKKISQGEYKELTNKLTDDNNELKNNYNYKLGKISIIDSIVTIVTTLVYFGIVQYILKGQTIGKKILKLKIVSASDKKITIINYLLRSLLLNNVLLNIIGIIFLATSSIKVYYQADQIISSIVSIIEAIIIFLILTREDNRGLHDILFNTKVIDLETISTTTVEEPKKNKNKKK